MKDFSNENIIHIKNNGLEYIQFKRLLQYSNCINHCFTLKDLNFRDIVQNEKDYKRICIELNIDFSNIVKPKQSHTDVVKSVGVNDVSSNFQDVDGLITNVRGKALSLVYADCTALIMYDPVKNAIANVHSGWRGTVQKIGKIAVGKMIKQYGCKPEDIICCICPTIRKCHFYVEEDVKDIFKKAFNDNSIIETGKVIEGVQKYNIDAVTANINMLINCGLKRENIIDSGICTVCNSDYFHSYRAHGVDAGRNTAIISLI